MAVLIQIVRYRLDWKQKNHEKIPEQMCALIESTLSLPSWYDQPFEYHFSLVLNASKSLESRSSAYKFISNSEPDDNDEDTFV